MVDAEALSFRAVPGGYVYRSPSPWVFGPNPHFLVDRSEREMLERAMKIRRPDMVGFLVVATLVLDGVVAGLAVWAVSASEEPTLAGLGAMTALILTLLYVELCVFLRVRMRPLRPIIATLAPTRLRVTNREIRQKMARRSSPRALLWVTVLQAAVTCCNLVLLAMSRDGSAHAVYMISSAVFGALSISTFVRWVRKARGGGDAAVPSTGAGR